jgi:hypothetical protein
VLTFAKMGWATFWAIFSQTHLVTLLESTFSSKWRLSLERFLKNS